jgi:uncharacterized membrane protein YhaH (DUF805 family)
MPMRPPPGGCAFQQEIDLSFFDAIRAAVRHYFNFSGRARRTEYWCFTLLASFLGFVFEHGVRGEVFASVGATLFWLVVLALVIPSLSVSVRRLHDVNRSGWWLLIGLVPFVGPLFLFFCLIENGTNGPNRFGGNPKARSGMHDRRPRKQRAVPPIK